MLNIKSTAKYGIPKLIKLAHQKNTGGKKGDRQPNKKTETKIMLTVTKILFPKFLKLNLGIEV